jgi:CDP-diacylglycerol--glycerol-3-phosphate 3-phosphatidyltransferase
MIANGITLSRLLWAAGFSVVVAVSPMGRPISTSLLAMLLALAAVEEASDFFDGIIARRTGTTSQLGSLLDPICDSLGRLTIYFSMALAGWVSIAVPLVMGARDLIVAYTRATNVLSGKSFHARWSGKIKAGVQGGGIFGLVLLAWLGGAWEHETALRILRYVVAALVIGMTGWSLLDYLRGAAPGIKEIIQKDRE